MALICRIWVGCGNLAVPGSRDLLVPEFPVAAAPVHGSLLTESGFLDRSLT